MSEWEKIDGDLILKKFGIWAVTTYGIERLDNYYPIEAHRLWEEDWIHHLMGRPGIEIENFARALNAAMEYHTITRPFPNLKPGARYKVMQRDRFRCQLCGATAERGARLEVDHIHPRAKGGNNDPENLWTLCFACNRGKRDRILEGR